MQNNKGIRYAIFLILMIGLSFGCRNENTENALKTTVTDTATPITTELALNLLAINCYICHDPKSSSHDVLLAPPLVGIKGRYLKATTERSAFIDRMSTFVFNPTKETALMQGPVNRFGLMPKTALEKKQIEAIVAFIYDNDIPAPDWFEAHEKEMHNGQRK